MRTTTLPSMLEVLARNLNFSNENVRLFELGSVYIPNEDVTKLHHEGKVLTFGLYGDADFYTVKGIIENVLALAAIKNASFAACTDNVSYHPGRCATVSVGDAVLGVFGQIHPTVAARYGADCALFAAEIDFDALFAARNAEKVYKSLPKFPAITRDFSLVCDEELEVGKIIAVMKKAGGKQTEDVRLFDIYRGPQIGEGKKSVSFRMTLRAEDHTLTIEDAERVSKKVLTLLDRELGLTLRG
jgi:phenylalanyl-tRNA synthetase beta chain